MIRAYLRSSHCALHEYLYGTEDANKRFALKSIKNISGNTIGKIEKYRGTKPKQYVSDDLLIKEHKWLYYEKPLQRNM